MGLAGCHLTQRGRVWGSVRCGASGASGAKWCVVLPGGLLYRGCADCRVWAKRTARAVALAVRAGYGACRGAGGYRVRLRNSSCNRRLRNSSCNRRICVYMLRASCGVVLQWRSRASRLAICVIICLMVIVCSPMAVCPAGRFRLGYGGRCDYQRLGGLHRKSSELVRGKSASWASASISQLSILARQDLRKSLRKDFVVSSVKTGESQPYRLISR